jgi:hypothetical protein
MAKKKNARIHPYSDEFVQAEQALAELADSLDLYITRDGQGYDLRRIDDNEFIDQSLRMDQLEATLLGVVAHRLGLDPEATLLRLVAEWHACDLDPCPENGAEPYFGRRWRVWPSDFAKVIKLIKLWPAIEEAVPGRAA